MDDLYERRDPRTTINPMSFGAMNGPGQEPEESAQPSILESLAPNANFAVDHAPLVQHEVKADTNAGSLIAPNRDAVANVQADVRAMKAEVTETIRDAQQEVCAAAESLGHDAGALYPDNRIAAGGELAVVAQASLGMPWVGKGSFVTALKHTPDVGLIAGDMKGSPKNRETAEAEIKAALIASSEPVDTRAGGGMVLAAGGPEEQAPSSLDWGNFFENGHELADLMSIDPDNPSPELVPEFAALDQSDREADRVLESLNDVAIEVAHNPSVDKNLLSAEQIDYQVSNSFAYIDGAKAGKNDLAFSEDAKRAVTASYNLEFDPRKIGMDAKPAVSAGMSA